MKTLFLLILLSLFSVFAGFSQILPVPAPPIQTPISADFAEVVDYAHLIDAVRIDQLNKLLKELKQKTTASSVVLTVKTRSQKLDRAQAEAYAALIYKEWNLTNTPVDNTVLFLVTMDETFQMMQPVIYRGKDIQEIIDQIKVEKLVDRFFTPAIQRKEYAQGIYETTWALVYILAQAYQKTLSEPSPFAGDPLADPSGSTSTVFWIIGFMVILAFVYHRVRSNNPEFSWLNWLPGKRQRAIAQDTNWRGAFERGDFGGLR